MSLPVNMKYSLLVLFSLFIVACSSNKPKESVPEVMVPDEVGAETAGASDVGVIQESSSLPEITFDQLDKTIYFGFDRAVITPASKQALDQVAAYMKENAQKLRLEGHTDERGSREYNMALGERRGNAVKDYLVAQGISSGRLEVISYGEEKPMVRSSTAAAYAKNRRVEIKLR